jgi:hypothetical protein
MGFPAPLLIIALSVALIFVSFHLACHFFNLGGAI